MICWLAFALCLASVGAMDEPASCVGESSLLQKQQHTAVRTLTPAHLTEGAPAAPAAKLTEGAEKKQMARKRMEKKLEKLEKDLANLAEEGEDGVGGKEGEGEGEGEGEEEGEGEGEGEGEEEAEEEEGAPAESEGLAPGNQSANHTEVPAEGAPADPEGLAPGNQSANETEYLVEGAPAEPAANDAEVAPAAPAANVVEVAPAAPAANVVEVAPAAPAANVVEVAPAAPAANLVEGAPAARAAYEGIPDEVLEKLIVSTPWKCDLLPLATDPRAPTCGLHFKDTGLHPAHLSELGNSSHDHMNSMRMLFPVGVLPCCSTMPFCGAPACSAKGAAAAAPAQTCTKSRPKDNFGYMSNAAVWPAYHGWAGSYEIDVMKHVDIIGTLLRQAGRAEPVDLVIDIGANSGFITEKLTTRHFAKDYILVEAYQGMLRMFESRLGNAEFKQRWFAEQVPARPGSKVPNFEFLNIAVSNRSGGVLDLCVKDDAMWGAVNNGTGCPVDKVALDEVIPGRLSPAFRSAFAAAKSAYVKVDVEGYDQMALEGMAGILQEERGMDSNGAPKHLVNFIQLEVCVSCTEHVKGVENRTAYDVKTVTAFLESMGFESFLMGPRYLPLSHGSWDDSFNDFFLSAENSNAQTYPAFQHIHCPGPACPTEGLKINTFTADLFAVRATHPRATEIKVALGACEESRDFSLADEQYELPQVPA